MRPTRFARMAILVALAALVAAGAGSPATAGADLRVGLFASGINAPNVKRLAEGGTDVMRTPFYLDEVEAFPGGPLDWSQEDEIVGAAAGTGMTFLPALLMDIPEAFDDPQKPPLNGPRRARFRQFVAQAVGRYGPGGEFWQLHPELPPSPITEWQVWNEPNLSKHWDNNPDAREYARMLAYVGRTIRRIDPTARIVLAGMPEHHKTIDERFSLYLAELYAVRGARKLFDAVSLHNYSRRVKGAVAAIRKTRQIMDAGGDKGKEIWLTETGWASGGPDRHPTVTTIRGQTIRLTELYRALEEVSDRYRVEAAIWYSWRDSYAPKGLRDRFWFHSGLFDAQGFPKPAWEAFAEAAGGVPGSGPLPGG
jgi:polysaccharide biosynthesis protein PslG